MDQFYPYVNTSTDPNSIGQDLEELAGLHQSILGNRGLLSSVAGEQGIPGLVLPESLEVKKPWIDPPSGALMFDPQGSIVLPNPPPSADTIVLTYPVPLGYDGVINYLSCNFTGGGFVQGSGDLIWRILINQKPLLNFNSITSEKGTPQQGRHIGYIRVYSGDVLQWVVNHASNPALNGNVICSFTGYIYPSRGN
jgi:hypothetical protein